MTIHPGGAETADEALLRDQRAFYRRRAAEYDEWWQRRGRYDRGPDEAREWAAQVAHVDAALARFAPAGDVLELAAGTGWWTARLAAAATSLTVVDASPETLELNRRHVGRDDITYVVADLFRWHPLRRYDVLFFSFWLSHVPRTRFDAFWHMVAAALTPNGRVFFIDNRLDPARRGTDPYVFDERDDVQFRRLNDGSEHRVVKVFYEPDQLSDQLARLDWDFDVAGNRWFIWGSGTRRDPPLTP